MKSSNVLIFTLILALIIGCSGGGGSSSPPARTLVSLALSPLNPSIAKGAVQQFSATGTYSDSSTQDVTTAVTWTSSAASVATISNATGANGLATPVAAGQTQITAALGGVSGSTTLTVTSATLVSSSSARRIRLSPWGQPSNSSPQALFRTAARRS
jgi:trimeric autotransporter adhesin